MIRNLYFLKSLRQVLWVWYESGRVLARTCAYLMRIKPKSFHVYRRTHIDRGPLFTCSMKCLGDRFPTARIKLLWLLGRWRTIYYMTMLNNAACGYKVLCNIVESATCFVGVGDITVTKNRFFVNLLSAANHKLEYRFVSVIMLSCPNSQQEAAVNS